MNHVLRCGADLNEYLVLRPVCRRLEAVSEFCRCPRPRKRFVLTRIVLREYLKQLYFAENVVGFGDHSVASIKQAQGSEIVQPGISQRLTQANCPKRLRKPDENRCSTSDHPPEDR